MTVRLVVNYNGLKINTVREYATILLLDILLNYDILHLTFMTSAINLNNMNSILLLTFYFGASFLECTPPSYIGSPPHSSRYAMRKMGPENWWENSRVEGWPGFALAIKIKTLKAEDQRMGQESVWGHGACQEECLGGNSND